MPGNEQEGRLVSQYAGGLPGPEGGRDRQPDAAGMPDPLCEGTRRTETVPVHQLTGEPAVLPEERINGV